MSDPSGPPKPNLVSPSVSDRNTEAWMRELLNGPVDAILWECDAEAKYFTFISKSAEEILGYPVETWLNEPFTWANTLHPDDRESTVAFCVNETAAGKDHQFEYRCVRADGKTVWLHDRAYLVRDEEGKLSRLRGFMVDITQRKRAEERLFVLAEAGRILTETFEHGEALGSLGKLLAGSVAEWVSLDLLSDDGMVQRTSIGRDEAFATRSLQIDIEAEQGLGAVLRTGRPEMVRRADGAWTRLLVDREKRSEQLSLMCVPLKARRRVLGALTLARPARDPYNSDDLKFAQDLASRIALAIDNSRLFEKAQAASRAKDEFIAAVSHELRNPMTAILGWTALMRDQSDPELIRDGIQNIEESARTQARLIEDILDISRAILGKFRIDVSPIHPAEAIESAVRAIQPIADEKGVQLEAILERETGPVLADPDRLQQIVWNFLSNAMKFTSSGGKITVGLKKTGDLVSISVTDTGDGIEAELLPHVFERFRQGRHGSTRGGLGIGLAIVKHLVEMQGGSVEVSSEGEGKGATFTANLPLVKPTGSARTTESRIA